MSRQQQGMPDGYVDVAERLQQFYAKYPDGRITRQGEPEILAVGDRLFVKYTALAYRTPDDAMPCVGTAWEPFPGPTPFTKDSELMNAETAAWGRAIIAAGIPSKRIASADEVANRRGGMAAAPAASTTLTPSDYQRVVAAYQAAGAPEQELVDFLNKLDAPPADDIAHRVAGLNANQAEQAAMFLEAKAIPAGALTPKAA